MIGWSQEEGHISLNATVFSSDQRECMPVWGGGGELVGDVVKAVVSVLGLQSGYALCHQSLKKVFCFLMKYIIDNQAAGRKTLLLTSISCNYCMT